MKVDFYIKVQNTNFEKRINQIHIMIKNSFDTLDIKQKGRILFTQGKNLAVIQDKNHVVNLFLLDNFYVEVYYHHKDNRIQKIEVLEDMRRLDLYIDYMNKSGT